MRDQSDTCAVALGWTPYRSEKEKRPPQHNLAKKCRWSNVIMSEACVPPGTERIKVRFCRAFKIHASGK